MEFNEIDFDKIDKENAAFAREVYDDIIRFQSNPNLMFVLDVNVLSRVKRYIADFYAFAAKLNTTPKYDRISPDISLGFSIGFALPMLNVCIDASAKTMLEKLIYDSDRFTISAVDEIIICNDETAPGILFEGEIFNLFTIKQKR